MPRPLLPEDRIHPAIRDKIAKNHHDIIDEVEAAIAKHAVVVVGMKQNPYPRRARKALTAKGIPFHYLQYGSYLSTWRRRTARIPIPRYHRDRCQSRWSHPGFFPPATAPSSRFADTDWGNRCPAARRAERGLARR